MSEVSSGQEYEKLTSEMRKGTLTPKIAAILAAGYGNGTRQSIADILDTSRDNAKRIVNELCEAGLAQKGEQVATGKMGMRAFSFHGTEALNELVQEDPFLRNLKDFYKIGKAIGCETEHEILEYLVGLGKKALKGEHL